MSRLMTAILLTGALLASAEAEEVVVGTGGGFFCTDAKYIIEMMESSAKGKKADLSRGCTELRAGVKFNSNNVEKLDNMAIGLATIDGNENVPFIVYIQKMKPTSEGRSFKKVSPDDVRNTPQKWSGRDIEFSNASVYYVEDDDVRIITNSMLTLFATDIRGGDKVYFKENCETQAEALSRKCRATVRFKYERYGEDQPSGLAKRVVLKSDDVELIRPAKGR